MYTLFEKLEFSGEPIFLASAIASVAIVVFRHKHIRFTAKGHGNSAIQSAHDTPTPRVGGLALVLGLMVALNVVSGEECRILGLVLFASLPLFIMGLMEDIGRDASPRARLLAACASGGIFLFLSGATLGGNVAPFFDVALGHGAIAFVFTVFVIAAFTHSFNLIDGLNGLSLSVAMVACIALSLIAFESGDQVMSFLFLAVFTACLGIFFVNFPLGKIFMGDAGAYTLGFVLVTLALALLDRNSAVTPWALLLCLFWPFIDTSNSVVRRVLKKKKVSEPDCLHFHQLVYRLNSLILPKRAPKVSANFLATCFIVPLMIVPAYLGVVFRKDALISFALVVLFSLIFVVARYGLFALYKLRSNAVRRSAHTARLP